MDTSFERPKVSIIIPVYNHEKYIAECVDSVLSQTYDNLEIIVVDDGSTDKTPQILKSYGSAINYIRQPNRGAANALNEGIKASSGQYVAWLSSDDAFLPDKIKQQVLFFNRNPEFDICYTDWLGINEKGEVTQLVKCPWYEPDIFASKLIYHNFINGTSILMKRKLWEACGGFNERIPAAVDAEMWYNLILKGYKFGHLPEVLVKYRSHPENQSSNLLFMRRWIDYVYADVFQKYPFELLYGKNAVNKREESRFYIQLTRFCIKGRLFRASCVTLSKVIRRLYVHPFLLYYPFLCLLKFNSVYLLFFRIKSRLTR